MFCKEKKNNLFTLIEMLVVIAIIGILAAMLMPALQKALYNAQGVKCRSTLKQYGCATLQYSDASAGILPNSFEFIDELYQYFGFASYDDMKNSIEYCRCPSDDSTKARNRLNFGWLSYGGNAMSLSYIDPWHNTQKKMSNYKGFSKIIAWGDSCSQTSGGSYGWVIGYAWDGKTNSAFRHEGYSNATYLDGHVGKFAPVTGTIDDGHQINSIIGPGDKQNYYPWGNGDKGDHLGWVYD